MHSEMLFPEDTYILFLSMIGCTKKANDGVEEATAFPLTKGFEM